VNPLLCADIGNSHTTIGLVADGEVVDHWRVATDERRTADEWGVLLKGLLHDSPVEGRRRGVAVCATVPAVLHEWRDMLRMYHGDVPHVVVEPGVRTGVPVLMDNPREVGTDRIVNAVAAYDEIKADCIVVDFGTATTWDVVSPRGEYLGGVIAPGITISSEALYEHAAKLPRVELARPGKVVARNTVASMQAGLVYGYAGMVDALVERIRGEIDFAARCIATGGLAPLIATETRTIEATDELLTLKGLKILYQRNA